jgi:predicted dehydrogenase
MNVAVIGAGKQGSKWINVLRNYNVNLYIVEPDTKKHTLNFKWFTDYKSITDAITAVIIASPIPYHFKQAKFFLDCGIPVLLEKPACGSIANLKELYYIAVNHRRHLQIGYLLRYHPAYKEIVSFSNCRTVEKALFRRRVDNPPKQESPIWHLAVHDIDLAFSIGLSHDQIVYLPTISFDVSFNTEKNIKIWIKYDDGATAEWDGNNKLYLTKKKKRKVIDFSKFQLNLLEEQFKDFVINARNPIEYCKNGLTQDMRVEFAAETIINEHTDGCSDRNIQE